MTNVLKDIVAVKVQFDIFNKNIEKSKLRS